MIGYNIDLASIALYLFWAFFAGLIYYLHRENKREGYPLVTDRKNEPMPVLGFPAPPPPKTYLLADGKKVVVDGRADNRPVKADMSARSRAPLWSRPEIRWSMASAPRPTPSARIIPT